MNVSDVITIFLAIIGSSALFKFIEFLITRKDSKKDKSAEVLEQVKELKAQVDKGFIDTSVQIDAVRSEMKAGDESIRASFEATKATTARVRILRASDEILHRMKHSKEWFDQLNDDITFYETYCRNHPEFVNNKAKHAIENINQVYAKALKDGDFL